jgi:hypothetical protein
MRFDDQVVIAKGDAYQNGCKSGQRLATSIATNMEIFWTSVAELGFSSDMLIAYTFEDEDRLPANLRQEIRGMADGSGQPYRDLLAYNLYRGGIACDC